ncbi:ADP/ATP carrier protein [Coelomomyces lativittatus]|nr:ADP/ATP carrier protein [Coelomomyces lativittatus]
MSKSQLTPFGHATSGAFGAALALIITYPIDIVKTRSQAASSSNDLEDNQEFFSMRSRRSMAYTYLLPPFRQIQTSIKHILRKEGWKGLYTGLPASIVGCMGSNFSYFYYYFYIKLLFHQRYPSPPSTSTQLLLSALAGILSQLFTLPSSVIITRQQTDPPHSRLTIWQTCQSIFQHSGKVCNRV